MRAIAAVTQLRMATKRSFAAVHNRDRAQEAAERVREVHDTEYLFAHGLRHVVPYPFTYQARSKARWFGRTVVDVCADEFKHWSRDYFESAVTDGRVRVRGQLVAPSYVLAPLDTLTHVLHRHEPSVCAAPITIVHETAELVVVSKPPSMAIHPSGHYRRNTLVYILEKEVGVQFFPVHRLDKLTSGLMILARSAEIATRYQREFSEQNVHKVYVARVQGEFPADGEVTVDQPIACIDRGRGVHAVRAHGKPAQTAFRRLSFNGHTSVVECRPLTGRTHQIRVHLHWLGHPIANDRAYGGQNYLSNTFTNMHGFEYASAEGGGSGSGDSDGVDASAPLAHAAPLSELQRLSAQRIAERVDHSNSVLLAPDMSTSLSSSSASSSTLDIDATRFPPNLPRIDALRRIGVSFDAQCAKCCVGNYWNDYMRYPGLIWLHSSRYTIGSTDLVVPSPHWAHADFDSRAALATPVADTPVTIVGDGSGGGEDEAEE